MKSTDGRSPQELCDDGDESGVDGIAVMKKKIGFAAAIALVALAILSTRYYEVGLPVWRFLGGGKDPTLQRCT